MMIIAFISQKEGVGKSTLAQTLAVEAKKQKYKKITQIYPVFFFFFFY
ncbi:MAG: hypothetical protein I3274_08215 [Candidatus Moeniiplasma glomeromycotorum]|nr:hypothetical protein [Candidatus Moeniiplasma glomeromycotorum]